MTDADTRYLRITAEIPATVLELGCGPGDPAVAGRSLLLLESMKMEIPVRPARSGTVSEVHVAVGDFVRTGDPLVSLRVG
ncbi:acetyl-CoA carboxylase biotin carboxyl carrier protein [Pseudonocardia sediminis]|uniref:Acetyl-CoA carboxylase biotin carboxyl carrier protein n=1 Tax=Pseudonocardia sediminis TaxID=1397368 RepID=A0A4Q7V262_PSEST|nr:acetyl-CoA carboxylase biotin carboxyl carrier protein subunit [Pseudonocardia sediminis]RZT88642.1 acetyl-CoA carboxylase biotin carboxyl carrier protein [Pseudonocardia sediminis]